MSFLENIGSFFGDIGKGIWEKVGDYGGAIGGAIGGLIGGQRGSQVGGQIGGGFQQISNPQASQYRQPSQPTYARAGCFIATECYDSVPQKFYDFKNRLPSFAVNTYYKISPCIVSLIRFTHSHKFIRKVLNILIRG